MHTLHTQSAIHPFANCSLAYIGGTSMIKFSLSRSNTLTQHTLSIKSDCMSEPLNESGWLGPQREVLTFPSKSSPPCTCVFLWVSGCKLMGCAPPHIKCHRLKWDARTERRMEWETRVGGEGQGGKCVKFGRKAKVTTILNKNREIQLCRCRSLQGLLHPPHEKRQDGYFEIPGLLWGTAQVQVGPFFCQNGWPALWSLPSSKGQTVTEFDSGLWGASEWNRRQGGFLWGTFACSLSVCSKLICMDYF